MFQMIYCKQEETYHHNDSNIKYESFHTLSFALLCSCRTQLIGIFILGASVYVALEPGIQDIIYASNREHEVQKIVYGTMGLGAFTLLVAIFGCCGAYFESTCLLGTYFTILLLIFLMQTVCVILLYVFRVEVSWCYFVRVSLSPFHR